MFWLWVDKCKWATLIYLGILLEAYSEPCQASNGAFCKPLEEVQRIKGAVSLLLINMIKYYQTNKI